jgi:hypothetical protein
MQNVEKSLRLLNLPSEMAAINGQINTRVTKSLVEICVRDHTQMVRNEQTGKFEPTVTSQFVVESTTSLFGMYPLNLAANHLNWSGFELVGFEGGVFTMYRPFEEITLPDGTESWIGWSEIKVAPTAEGYDYNFYYEQGYNSYFGEKFAHDENVTWRSILRKTYIKTTSTPNPTRFIKSYPRYTIAQLKEKTGMNEYQIAEAFATTWKIEAKDSNTHCLNIASDIVINENTFSGEAYVNGILPKDINYRSLISSYGKTLPGMVGRWKLYNDEFNKSTDVFGAAWHIVMPVDDNTITLEKGSTVEYNSETKVLTYPDNSKLIFDFEFLPAQGKNETVGCCIDLETMEKSLW